MTPHSPSEIPGSVLKTETNLEKPDDFYQDLVEMHRDLSDQQSMLVNAKLILLLANHIGSLAVLREAIRAARQNVEPETNVK